MLCTLLCCSKYSAICCSDITTSCINSDAVSAKVFVNMMLFTKENITFSDILRQGKCYSAR